MPRVFIPPAVRPLTDGQEFVDIAGVTVAEVIENLEMRFPGTRDRLCRNGSIRPGISVVVAGSATALGLLQRTQPDDEIHFLPAVGGG